MYNERIYVATINIAFKHNPEHGDASDAVPEHAGRMFSNNAYRGFIGWELAQNNDAEGSISEAVELQHADPDSPYGQGDIFQAARDEGLLIGGDTSGPLLRLINKLYLELDRVESFISGFEYDDMQVGVGDMLDGIRSALSEAKPYYTAPEVVWIPNADENGKIIGHEDLDFDGVYIVWRSQHNLLSKYPNCTPIPMNPEDCTDAFGKGPEYQD